MIKPISVVYPITGPQYRIDHIFKAPLFGYAFGFTPLHDKITNEPIGHEIRDCYVHTVATDQYFVRIIATFFLKDRGTITWMYNFSTDTQSYDVPKNVPIVSTFVSGTDEFFGTSGTVRLVATDADLHDIEITFSGNP